jgi:hypothetical protein
VLVCSFQINHYVNRGAVQSLDKGRHLLVYFHSRLDAIVVGVAEIWQPKPRLFFTIYPPLVTDFLRREHAVLSRTLGPAFSVLICIAAAGAAYGQTKPSGGPTPSPAGAVEYFVDIKDGATLPAKATIHFGLRGMDLAPAAVDRPNSGHHHLLIDTDLPPLNEPIPNDFNHLHFGNGQTEAEINLSPGEHTLQLLLGDHNHVPHTPPIMSDRIRVRVGEAGASAAAPAPTTPETAGRRHASAPNAKVYFISPTDGESVSSPFVVRFGLINMGIAPAGMEKAGTGHHHLMVDAPLPPFDQPIPPDFNHLHFGGGQTETQLTLPPGEHTLQLLLADESHLPHDPPVYSKQITVTVTAAADHRLVPLRKRHRKHWVFYE